MEQRLKRAREGSSFFVGAICTLAIAALAFCAALLIPQHNAYAVTDGWEQWGTCEWQIDDEGTLTIRPVDDGETGMLGDTTDNFSGQAGNNIPWHNRTEDIYKVVISKPISTGEDASNLFAECTHLSTIDELDNLNTSATKYFNGMFLNCTNLTSIDCSSFNTASAENMSGMFSGCKSAESINVDSFDTTNVTSMDYMFGNCEKLTELDVSHFATQNVKNMFYLFGGCSNLKSLNVSNFDTSNVYEFSGMFSFCSSLIELDTSHFVTSNALRMTGLFEGCSSLRHIDVSNFDTGKVESMQSMFYQCFALESIDVSSFSTSHVTSTMRMFYDCRSLTNLNISNFDMSRVENTMEMFWGCASLSSIQIPDNFLSESCIQSDFMFAYCDSLQTIPDNFSFGPNAEYLTRWGDIFEYAPGEEPLATYYEGDDENVINYDWESDNRRLITPAGNIAGTVTIIGHPCAGMALKATVSLDGSCADAQPAYQWFDASNDTAVSGATDSAEFAIPEGSEGKSFYCVVTDGSGAYGSSLKSETLTASHSFGEWVTTTEPTCTSEGEQTRTCENCDATETQSIPVAGHSPINAWQSDENGHWHACANCDEHLDAAEHELGDWAEKDAATCTEGGTEARTCSTCGYEETRATDPAGHSFGEWKVTTPATCTTDGVESRACEKCGAVETRTIDATGHSFGEWVTTTEPTCTEEGEQTRTCDACGATETQSVPATGHTADETWESDATDHWHVCVDCGAEMDSAAHEFGEWTTTIEPTEDVAGERERTCEVCDHVETAEIPATGHTADDTWHSDENGHWHVCTGCGAEIEKSAHEYGEWTVTKEATCTEDGTKARVCEVCGFEETEAIPATGHSFGEWEVTTESTCVDEGEETRTCANCDATETRPVPATGQHVYLGWTSDENGHRHVCEICGLVADDAEHEFGDWSVKTAATCTEDGTEARSCTVCGYEETRTVAATGHVPAAEWSSDASEHWHACANCDEHLDATAHDFGEWTVTKKATCTEAGSQNRTCATCGYVETAEIPALGHTFGDWEVISDATETQDGSKKHVCEVCGFEETVVIPATGGQQGGGQQSDQDSDKGDSVNDSGQQTGQGDNNAASDSASGSDNNSLAQTGDRTPVAPLAFGALATLAIAGFALKKLRA